MINRNIKVCRGIKNVLLFCLFLCVLCSPATARKKNVKKLITPEAVEAQLSFLASDELEGRFPGSKGWAMAGEYIIGHFKANGIKPYFPSEDYCQPIGQKEHRGMRLGRSAPSVSGRNIVGMIEGKKRDEYVIVGAHYDHLGIGTAVDGDSIYNGADDNASGVVAVLQLARAFSAQRKQPERTILFALWDGEEEGLLGSFHFAVNFADSSRIKAYVNFDMIGRDTQPGRPGQFTFFYDGRFPVFAQWQQEAIKKHRLGLSPNFEAMEERHVYIEKLSDYWPFSARKRPFVFYTTDRHADLHKPSDEIEKINIEKATAIIQSAYYLIDRLSKQADYPAEASPH